MIYVERLDGCCAHQKNHRTSAEGRKRMRTAAANDDGTPVVDFRADRERRTKLIVESRAPKKLISAGPGTGKTTTFKRALAVCGGRGLALTFINSLVEDLEDKLADVADVFTFHGFCKYLLHRINVPGLTKGFEYYPPLFVLLSEDLKITGPSQCTPEEIEHLFHRMDDSGGVISTTLKLGSYYDSVGHSDSVFRVQQHFHNCHAVVPAYPLIVVDEYQDFNRLEVEFIRLLSTKSPVLIVGDDDQALYAFKDADPRFIRELAGSSEFEKFELPYLARPDSR
jgi:superfamily I DNA/RNA helicase